MVYNVYEMSLFSVFTDVVSLGVTALVDKFAQMNPFGSVAAAIKRCNQCRKEISSAVDSKYGGVCGKCYRRLPKKERKKHVRIPPTQDVKIAVIRRDFNGKLDGKCFVCGQQLLYDNVVMGHIVPHKDGGDVTPENLRAICSGCNLAMGDENLYSYMQRRFPEKYALLKAK